MGAGGGHASKNETCSMFSLQTREAISREREARNAGPTTITMADTTCKYETKPSQERRMVVTLSGGMF